MFSGRDEKKDLEENVINQREIQMDEEAKEELLKIEPIVSEGYKTLKKVIKINGHFKLVEVESEQAYITIIL